MIPPVEKIPVLIRTLLLGWVQDKGGGTRARVRSVEPKQKFLKRKVRRAKGFSRKT